MENPRGAILAGFSLSRFQEWLPALTVLIVSVSTNLTLSSTKIATSLAINVSNLSFFHKN